MRPPSPLRHLVFGTIDKVAALLGATEPLHWLTTPPGRSKKHRKPESAPVLHRLAPDDTPEGLAAAVPYVAVFEVTPA